MNKHIKNYLKSFNFNKKYWYTFIVDGLTFFFITLLFLGLGKILEKKAYAISQGKTTEQLKALLLSGSVETNKLFLANIKSFTFYLVLGIVVALIVSLFIYSLSRTLVWNKLLKQKSKKYWSWAGLSVILTIVLFLYLLFYKIVLIFIPLELTPFQFALNGIIGSLFIFIFMVFFFLVNYSFATEGKVWSSIGNAFHLIKLYWKRLWKMFVLTIVTWLLLRVALYFVFDWFKIVPEQLFSSVLSIVVSLLFLAWLRLYLLRTMGKGSISNHSS